MTRSDDPRVHFYQCRLNEREATALESAIAESGLQRAEWMRRVLLQAAEREVRAA